MAWQGKRILPPHEAEKVPERLKDMKVEEVFTGSQISNKPSRENRRVEACLLRWPMLSTDWPGTGDPENTYTSSNINNIGW